MAMANIHPGPDVPPDVPPGPVPGPVPDDNILPHHNDQPAYASTLFLNRHVAAFSEQNALGYWNKSINTQRKPESDFERVGK